MHIINLARNILIFIYPTQLKNKIFNAVSRKKGLMKVTKPKAYARCDGALPAWCSLLRTVLLRLLRPLVLSNSCHGSVSSKNLQWLIWQTLIQPYLCLLLKPWARNTKLMKDALQGAYTQGQERPVDRRTDTAVWQGTHEERKEIREQKGPSSPSLGCELPEDRPHPLHTSISQLLDQLSPTHNKRLLNKCLLTNAWGWRACLPSLLTCQGFFFLFF